MKRYFTGRLAVIGLVVLAGVTIGITPAAASEALLNKLVEKGILSQEEASEVRTELSEEQAATAALYQKTKVSSWIEQLKWSGDLRLRGEYFEFEDSLDKADRWRFRVRLRLGVDWQIQDWASIHVRLASGTEEATSTNQTLGDGFSSKPIWIDRAYVQLQPPDSDWLKVRGGKIKNPNWQPSFGSPMQYDGDLNPEGVAELLRFHLDDEKRQTLFANFGQYIVDEDSGSGNDPFLFDFQGGLQSAWGGEDARNAPLKTAVAVGYMFTHNLDNYEPDDFFGNASNTVISGTSTNRFYLDDFEVVNVRGEAAWQFSDDPLLGTPAVLTLAGEYVTNLANAYGDLAGDQTEGYAFQVQLGKTKQKGTWKVAYQYKHMEADATWDAITDSDWGTGGTDRKGHLVKAAYQLQDWWQLGVTAFVTEKISDRDNDISGAKGEELLRIQLDSVFKF